MEVMVILTVNSELRIDPTVLEKGQEESEIRGRIGTIQTTVWKSSLRIRVGRFDNLCFDIGFVFFFPWYRDSRLSFSVLNLVSLLSKEAIRFLVQLSP